MQVCTSTNIEQACISFNYKLTENICKCTETVNLKIKSNQIKRNSWVTKEIMKSIETKNNLARKMKMSPSNEKNCKELDDYINKLKHLIEQREYEYYKSTIECNQGNPKKK